jgi:hypothetical protein
VRPIHGFRARVSCILPKLQRALIVHSAWRFSSGLVRVAVNMPAPRFVGDYSFVPQARSSDGSEENHHHCEVYYEADRISGGDNVLDDIHKWQ